MNMTVKKDEPLQIIPASETAAILSMVARAASDPSCDIDKLERLMTMQREAVNRQAMVEYNTALTALQSELPSIGERGDANGRYKFALWEDINTVIKPILNRHGFALSFRIDSAKDITVTGVLSHRNGHSEQTSITLPSDGSGNKNAVQAVASSVSYGKRYTASALLNLTSHGEDDDAYSTSPEFDISGWAEAITNAVDMVELTKIANDLKTKDIPAKPLKNIRALWAKRSKEVK